MSTTFNPFTDVWTLLYDLPDPPVASLNVTKATVAGDVVAIATSLVVPTSGTWGILLRNATETVRLYMGSYIGSSEPAGSLQVPISTAPLSLMLAWTDADNQVTGTYSIDGESWTALETTVTMASTPTHADLFYEQFSVLASTSVSFGQFRVLAGALALPPPIYAKTFLPIGAAPVIQPPALTPTQMAVIHALVGAQFGDLEFDVGKSVRWTQWFTDDVFITDVNYGTQRFWIIDWTKSFPEVNFQTAGGGVSFFDDPVTFRKRQFSDAEAYARNNPAALVFDNDDWIMFVDAHEGLSVDNTVPFPNDYDFDLFRSYVVREIEVANAAGRNTVVLPFFAYVRHDNIQNVQYDWDPGQAEDGPKVTQNIGVPYYIPTQGLVRLMKVSALRNPAFNWSSIDQPSAPTAGTKIQIISYGYAHWNEPVIPPGGTGVPALTADNDLGWRQRNLLSKMRPISGLPFGETWQFPESDNQGLAGPWALDTFEGQPTGIVIPEPRPPIDPAVAGVRVPLYDTVLRLNLRDGVWYAGDGTGNTPLDWDEASQQWVPASSHSQVQGVT